MDACNFWYGCHQANNILDALEEAQWRRSGPVEVLRLLAIIPTGGSFCPPGRHTWWSTPVISYS